jgi:hypothetical protein
MGVLLLLMTIGGLFVAIILLITASLTRKAWLAKFTLGGVAVWLVFYAAMLLGVSLTSKEKVVVVGDTDGKAFCGFYLDCHLHTAVTGVRTAKTIGNATANGTFYIANVRVFSDARNPEINLHLIQPKARVVQTDGKKVERDLAAEALLPTANVRLDANIDNKQSIEKEIVFDVPATATDVKLLITEGYGIDKNIEHVLVGDEDSLFHAQTFFDLREQTQTAGVK